MLAEFLYRNDFTLLLLQEVTHTDLARIRDYDSHMKIEADMRGTAMLVRHTDNLDQVIRLPSGRGMAASYKDLRVANIYAPAGTAKKLKGSTFIL
jgi:exonuclease III